MDKKLKGIVQEELKKIARTQNMTNQENDFEHNNINDMANFFSTENIADEKSKKRFKKFADFLPA